MKHGWRYQGILSLILFLLMVSTTLADSGTWIQVIRLDTGEDVTPAKLVTGEPGITIHLYTHQIIALELVAAYTNDSPIRNYRGFFKEAWDSDFPEFVENWENSDRIVPSNETVRIRQVVYIRPMQAAVDSFKVTSFLRLAENEGDPGWNTGKGSSFKVIVQVTDMDSSRYQLPKIVTDPGRYSNTIEVNRYAPGSGHVLTWRPAAADENVHRIIQDAYGFPSDDRENLKMAVQNIYGVRDGSLDPDSLKQSYFADLQSGEQYGYFIKAVYESGDTTLTFYSDIHYSIQDNEPPAPVSKPLTSPDGNSGDFLIWWGSVQDALSGTSEYRIFRSSDTSGETVLDTLFAEPGLDSLVYKDHLESGATYYYRVRAVDNVGNIGQGEVSDGIYFGESSGGDVPVAGDSGAGSSGAQTSVYNLEDYLAGTVDHLQISLEGWEKEVRFISVRDDTSYFSDPPDAGMRVFDSGWVSPTETWSFDYARSVQADSPIDRNFVNNHVYHRRVLRKSITDKVSREDLGSVVPDCFPPEDIHNLRVEAVIEDADFERSLAGYSKWQIRIGWDHATDGGSGLKRYHIYRKVQNVDDAFHEIPLPDDFAENRYTDTYTPADGEHTNPVIWYRVTSEDRLGQIRHYAETVWEASDRALGAPEWLFQNFEKEDTLFYTSHNFVILELNRRSFYVSDVDSFIVSINGRERGIPVQDTIRVFMPEDEFSRINVRAMYAGKRSSIWSGTKVVSGYRKRPANLMVLDDPTFWTGDIHLQWNRPSLDAYSYQVWRKIDGGEWHPLDRNVVTDEDTVHWVDYYGRIDSTGLPGDTLVVYRDYFYKVKMITNLGEESEFSDSIGTYCDLPPDIRNHTMRLNGNSHIRINWERARPSIASGGFCSRVRVLLDGLDQVIYDTQWDLSHVVDDSTFIYYGDIEPGHNYIFQIMEMPEFPVGKASHWSQPYTVSLLLIDSLFVQPQPGGAIFLTWETDQRIYDYPIDHFHLWRASRGDTVRWSLGPQVKTYIDPAGGLEHAREYTYHVFAFDTLGQIVATNSRTVKCDTGQVYIPTPAIYDPVYFNADSVDLRWFWTDEERNPLDSLNRGAHEMLIQASISRRFPDRSWETTSSGWFPASPADFSSRVRTIAMPEGKSVNNRIIYYRMTARDRWGHPEALIWSGVRELHFDPVPPFPADQIVISRTEAYYRGPDSLEIDFQWNDGSILDEDPYTANVDFYRIEGVLSGDTVATGNIYAQAGRRAYSYTCIFPNRDYDYSIVTRDSAGNIINSAPVTVPYFIPTPVPPTPVDFRKCVFESQLWDGASMESFIEIAMDSSHFSIAYELEHRPVDHLLCQSGWTEEEYFECRSGWGSIETDTTWFRIKVRFNPQWESGWSVPVFYTLNPDSVPVSTGIITNEQIPERFQVYPNYPNPFNAETVIGYAIPEHGDVRIDIYNIRGSYVCRLWSGYQSPGEHSVSWDGHGEGGSLAASGVYIAHIRFISNKGYTEHRRMKLMMIK
jgi:hypothetical protein